MKTIVAIAALCLASAAAAQDAGAPFRDRTERVQLQGRRGPSLFRPGFGIAEYVGSASARSSGMALPFRRSAHAKTSFSLTIPSLAEEVRGECEGGQARAQFLWITFEREPLSYNCVFAGAAPPDAAFTLALSRHGSWLNRLQQPQRAGELTWNGTVYRAETRYVEGLPWSSGGVLGYVFSRDGVDIGGVALNGMAPTFYLPPAGSPDRDAAALLGAILFTFQDPGRPPL
ncbi:MULTISPECIES: hypothetical protein [unclassified Brevundimonas]|uniref:hypothetical protein n=1 Tax=unclassified Brevundimonas TaxID=2622653 RepID=UPI0006F25860|nr:MULTISPECIES: hypothetical protein [unclassified Brevundimonas]KQY70106.1 hypothetical protein ASD25_13650 [Brevundimonas sp. Root1423]KRA28814.1 hypothetical protein ASD59_03090 [Brevundimonas sp. Root608]